MPYLVLVIGILVGGYALYRFLVNARVEQIRIFFQITALIVYGAILLFFAFTGRMMIALGLLVLAIPFVISHYKSKKRNTPPKDKDE